MEQLWYGASHWTPRVIPADASDLTRRKRIIAATAVPNHPTQIRTAESQLDFGVKRVACQANLRDDVPTCK